MDEKKKYIYSKEKVQEYNKRFLDKHKDLKLNCDICLQDYSYFSKSHHNKSKFHMNAVKIHELYKTED